MSETHYFITVDWCNKGKRGLFCNKQGVGYWKDTPHTMDEMKRILGAFWLILNPKSEPFTEEQMKNRKWFALAEYSYVYGIAVEVK